MKLKADITYMDLKNLELGSFFIAKRGESWNKILKIDLKP